MRKINYQQGFMVFFAAVLLVFTMISCDRMSKKRVNRHWSVEVSHEFPNTNWAVEEEVLEFSFDIEDTSKYYDISLSLLFDTSVVELVDIPLSLLLDTPDGMQSMSKSHFLLTRKDNPDLRPTGEGKNAEATVVVYPRRKFKAIGTYKLTVYRRAEKADNYGFKRLSARVQVVK